MRAIWKGSIAFGLVHIPVNLYPATETQGISSNLLHKKDHSRIRYQRVSEARARKCRQGYFERKDFLPVEPPKRSLLPLSAKRNPGLLQITPSSCLAHARSKQTTSQPDSLHLAQCILVFCPVIGLRCSWRVVAGICRACSSRPSFSR